MGVLQKYLFCALILGITFAHGLKSQTEKLNDLEKDMKTVILELFDVKTDLRVEQAKSITLENKLNELMDGKKVTAYDDKGKNILRWSFRNI